MNTETKELTIEQKIEGAINKDVTKTTLVSQDGGGIAFSSIEQVMEFSKMMAVSKAAVPVHLRNNPGACLGVCVQALEWRMSPFSVANKSYFVSERLAYEAQLIQAVINQRAPIEGRIKGEYMGEGGERQLRVWATLKDGGDIVEYTSPMKKDIKVQNSPLWKSDPDQQIWYYSTRAMCRRHFPDVILGVYASDEIKGGSMRDITPRGEESDLTKRLKAAQEITSHGDGNADVVVSGTDQNGDAVTETLKGATSSDVEKVSEESLPSRDINEDVDDAEVAEDYVSSEVDPDSDEFKLGEKFGAAGGTEGENPHKTNPEFTNWLGGFRMAINMKDAK